jgi:hypothetical protein
MRVGTGAAQAVDEGGVPLFCRGRPSVRQRWRRSLIRRVLSCSPITDSLAAEQQRGPWPLPR